MGALIMFGLVTAIAFIGCGYFAYQDSKGEKECDIDIDSKMMKESTDKRGVLQRMADSIPEHVQKSVDLSIDIADRIVGLMSERGVTSPQLADAMGVRLSMVARWISGQHNFDIDTIARLSVYFGQPVISVTS